MVRTDSIVKRCHGTLVLSDVSLTAERGQAVAIIGAPGSGRSTLLRIVATLIPPTSGRIDVCGMDAVARPFDVRRRVFWTGTLTSASSSPGINVQDYLRLVSVTRAAGRQAAADALAVAQRLGIDKATEIRTLTAVVRARLALAAAVAAAPDVLLLAERSDDLDSDAADVCATIISNARDRGAAILSALSLDGRSSVAWSRRVVLQDGRLHERGPLSTVGVVAHEATA